MSLPSASPRVNLTLSPLLYPLETNLRYEHILSHIQAFVYVVFSRSPSHMFTRLLLMHYFGVRLNISSKEHPYILLDC